VVRRVCPAPSPQRVIRVKAPVDFARLSSPQALRLAEQDVQHSRVLRCRSYQRQDPRGR
jgi:hypothetical protein